MKFLRTYFRKLFKPKFKPSHEDLLSLESIKLGKKATFLEEDNSLNNQEEKAYQERINLSLLLGIYHRTKLKTDRKSFNSGYINFKEIDKYDDFLKNHSEEKIHFLYFLINMVKEPPLSISYVEEIFKVKFFGAILATKLDLTSKNITDFFLFWKTKNHYSIWVPQRVLNQKIKQLSREKKVDIELVKTLERYVFYDVDLFRYDILHKDIEVYHRVIIDYRFRKETIPFFLIPDYFGKKINRIFLNFEDERVLQLSKILQLLSIKKRTEIQEKKLEQAVKVIDIEFFIEKCITIFELTSKFKSKLQMRFLWQSWEKKMLLIKDYFGMFNENLMIVFELVKLLQQKELINKIPIELITIIAKRSYTLKKDLRLSKASTKLGDLCAEILAVNYGKEGKVKLKEIYTEVPYKNVKKKIDSLFFH